MLSGEEIKVKSELKLLGVLVDDGLTFAGHMSSLAERVAKRLAALKVLHGQAWGPSCHSSKVLYHACVEAVAKYAMPVWATGGCTKHCDGIRKSLRDAARMTCGLVQSTNSIILRHATGLMPFEELREVTGLLLVDRLLRVPEHAEVAEDLAQRAGSEIGRFKRLVAEHVVYDCRKGCTRSDLQAARKELHAAIGAKGQENRSVAILSSKNEEHQRVVNEFFARMFFPSLTLTVFLPMEGGPIHHDEDDEEDETHRASPIRRDKKGRRVELVKYSGPSPHRSIEGQQTPPHRSRLRTSAS